MDSFSFYTITSSNNRDLEMKINRFNPICSTINGSEMWTVATKQEAKV
jgi:hypothetical protein